MMEKRRNKSDRERTYPMMRRVPLTDFVSWQEEGGDRRESSRSPSTGGEKNKQLSKSVFRVMTYTTELDILKMFHGWIGHI
jgi:hypothetical protein